MKKQIQIGEKSYKSKSEALLHYKTILNSYDFGETLNHKDFNDVIDLLVYDEAINNCINEESDSETRIEEVEQELFIENIRVAKVQFNTKCFERVWSDGTSNYTSYTFLINQPLKNADRYFTIACRNTVQQDLINLKQQYFKDNTLGSGNVKCQETGQICKWDDLVVDHRQPNTFSIILDRFKEVFQIDTNKIEYNTDDNNLTLFKDNNLSEKFKTYHKEKANLRVVKKEVNSSRSSMGRIEQNRKDLKIK